ncbi:MAG: multiheme c-type cytochrome [Longimicrobiales bacterium]|nr:multiheme c-type cytochrome [Longimicrobiales bacterium]
MGKSLLTLALAVLFAACDGPGGADDPTARPHADQTCASCHAGPRGERGRATVPAASCTTGGCHEAGGPEEVSVAAVRFPHRDHGEGGEIEPSCAGCHTHNAGEDPLVASVDACALCHIREVGSGDAQECRLCHGEYEHAELTSQGVTVAHSELPWLEIGCVRCHYDVVAGETDVTGQPCRQCHEDMAALNERAVGRDLHPIHSGVTCTSCHEANIHEVRAMSSVVDLVCSDCHSREHEVRIVADGGSGLCTSCHADVHSAQQRLVLGVRPDSGVTPSAKFLAGITCRSCHVAPRVRRTDQPVRGQAEACAGCHSPEYRQVLEWWREGLRLRVAAVQSYIEAADATAAPASDSARALLGDAQELLRLVAEGGGQHNLELSDQLLRDAVDHVRSAYVVTDRRPPASPDLGREPHMGLCSYCHYESTRMWNLRDMPEDFHRTVLGEP